MTNTTNFTYKSNILNEYVQVFIKNNEIYGAMIKDDIFISFMEISKNIQDEILTEYNKRRLDN